MVMAKPDPRFSGPGLHVLASHGDCVLKLPPDADLLALSPSAAVELWALGKDVLCIQSHPEMSAQQLETLILPGLTAAGRITPEEAAAAAAAIKRPLDNHLLLAMGRFFLHGEEGAQPAARVRCSVRQLR
jgi:hypothetical protein